MRRTTVAALSAALLLTAAGCGGKDDASERPTTPSPKVTAAAAASGAAIGSVHMAPIPTGGFASVTLLSADWAPSVEWNNDQALIVAIRVKAVSAGVRSVANLLCFAPDSVSDMAWRGRELDEPVAKGQTVERNYTLTPTTVGAGELRWADCAFRDNFNESKFGWRIDAP